MSVDSVFPDEIDEFTSPLDPAEGQYVWQDGTIRDGVSADAQVLVEADEALIHENQHALILSALLAIEQKLGADGSADTSSVDYKLGYISAALSVLDTAISLKQDAVPGLMPLGTANTVPTVNAGATALQYLYALNQSLQTVDSPTFAGVTVTGATANSIAGFDVSKGLVSITLSTSDISEGANLYFTNERAQDATATMIQNGTGITWVYNDASNTLTPAVSLSAFSTSDLSEGSNLYFTNSRADARITAQKATANGLATLDSGGKIPTSQLPALALTDTFVVNSQAAQLALTAEEGDVAVRTDLNKSYIHNGGTAGTMADWQELLTPTDTVLSVNGQTGAVTLTTTDINEGTNLYFTNERAQDAVGAMVDASLVYNDASNLLSRAAISGDASIPLGSNTLTFANVNSNVGTFGSATQAAVVTVNAKGLVTAANNVTITPAVGSITGLGAGVAAFLATPSSTNLAAAVTGETGTGALVFGTAPTFTTSIAVTATSQNDNVGIIQAENTTAGIANASITAKNHYGTSQFMQWENNGVRIGSRILTNSGAGNVYFTSGSDSTFMTALANGNVGLGVTPATRLHVKSGRVRIDQTDGASAAAVLEYTNGTDFMYWFLESVANGGKGQIRTDSARAIILQDNSTSSGGIGIGGTPTEKLHVYGNILATGDINGANVNVDNYLMNGGFDICQRIQAPTTATAFANNTYTLDRWYLMTDGGSSDIQCSRQAGDTNSRFAMRVNQSSVTARKWAVAQVIESNNCIPLRNQPVRFQARIKASSGTPNIRMAILEWTGAADIMGSARDLINAWANSADANPATTFFKSTSIIVRANIAATATSTSYADFSVTATLGSTLQNVIVVFWTPSSIAQNVNLEITQAGLYEGTNAKSWLPRPVGQELILCQRYCQQLWGDNFARFGVGSADTTSNVVVCGNFPVVFRVTPSLTSSTVGNFYVSAAVISFNIAYTTPSFMAINATVSGTPLSVGTTYQLTSGANNQFIRFDAEL